MAATIMDDAEDLSRTGRLLLRFGLGLIVYAALEGFVIPLLAAPRIALSVHTLAGFEGVFLLAQGLMWPQLRLSARQRNRLLVVGLRDPRDPGRLYVRRGVRFGTGDHPYRRRGAARFASRRRAAGSDRPHPRVFFRPDRPRRLCDHGFRVARNVPKGVDDRVTEE